MKYLENGMAWLRRQAIGERGWVVLIVLLAFGLRLYRLGAQAIWWDESLSFYRATGDLSTILANTILIQNIITHDLQPPLYFVILHFFVSASGISEFALRFLSVMANVATVPLLYGLARRWLSPSVAIVAAFLGALSPFYVWYAQEARPYALVLFLSLLAIYALTRAFAGWDGRPVARTWLLVYICSAVAALFTNYYAIFFIPVHVVLIALLVWRIAQARPFVLLPVLPLASAVFLVPLAAAGATENAAGGPVFVPFDVILRDLLNSFSVGITIDLAQVFWIDLALLALCLIGLVAFRRAAVFLVAFIAIPLLGLAAASLVRPLYQHSRYFIALSPAFYLGVAAGAVALTQRWKVMAVTALGVFLIGAALSLNNLYFDPSYGKDDHRAWADSLRERARPGDFLILDSPHTEALYRYYADDLVPMTTLPVLRADHVDSPVQDLAVVRGAYSRYARVWFLAMDVLFDDSQGRIDQLLNQEGTLIDRTEFRGTSTAISLSLFLPNLPVVQVTDIPHALDIAYLGHLHLRGYTAPDVIGAGQRATVTLYWQIDEPVGEDYAVSLRVIAPNGERAGQWDSIPLGNRAGSSTWQPKAILADVHDLNAVNITSGTFQLQVVPYHSATGTALGDVVTLGKIQWVGRAAQ
jgi:hypothetical protein